MISPRSYNSILKFKSSGPNDQCNNTWTATGSVNYSNPSKFQHLKYETATCFRYTAKNKGFIQTNLQMYNLNDEFTMSFWFKVSRELLYLADQQGYFPEVELVTWGNDNPESIKINLVDGGLTNIKIGDFAIPYPIEDHLDEWIHFMISREEDYDNGNKIRIFINGKKYYDHTDSIDNINIVYEGFDYVKLGNLDNDSNITFPVPIYIYIDEFVVSGSALTVDQFYPFPKYLNGFYPATDVKEFKNRKLKKGITRYDIVNDAIPITRPRYYKPPFDWKDDMITKYRFDMNEPTTESNFELLIKNRERPGIEYKKTK